MEDPDDLEDDEYYELTDWHPLMSPVLDFLAKKELGLAPSKDELEPVMIDAIVLVQQEILKQREQRRKQDQELKEAQREARQSLGIR